MLKLNLNRAKRITNVADVNITVKINKSVKKKSECLARQLIDFLRAVGAAANILLVIIK